MISSLSPFEMKLVTDADLLLTKNEIIEKVYRFFGILADDYKNQLTNHILIEKKMDAKISRGENYKGLPYVVLDYPRQFSRVDVFAIRCLFWWGNFFSITLQLAGEYQHIYACPIQKAIDRNLYEGWYISCSEDPWEHHFENSNYAPIEQGIDYDISSRSFLKIAKKFPLEKWEEAANFFKENFSFLIKVLNT